MKGYVKGHVDETNSYVFRKRSGPASKSINFHMESKGTLRRSMTNST